MYKRIKKATGKSRRKTTVSVSIPEECGDVDGMWEVLKNKRVPANKLKWRRETNTEEVEDLLLKSCSRHFIQTNDTPMSGKEWRTMMEPMDGDNKIKEILEGTLEVPESEQLVIRQLLEAAKRSDGVQTVNEDL